KIRISGAHALAKMGDDGKLNWLTLSQERSQIVQTQLPWQLRIASFDVENASVSFEDAHIKPDVKVEMSELAIHAEGISNKLDASIPFTLKGRVQENGSVDFSGTVAPSPLVADVKLDVRGVDLTSFRRYLETPSAPKLSSGRADLQGKMAVSGPAPKIGI